MRKLREFKVKAKIQIKVSELRKPIKTDGDRLAQREGQGKSECKSKFPEGWKTRKATIR